MGTQVRKYTGTPNGPEEAEFKARACSAPNLHRRWSLNRICLDPRTLATRYTDTPIHWNTGTRVHRYTGTPVHQYTNTPVCPYIGTPEHWYANRPVHQMAPNSVSSRPMPVQRQVCTSSNLNANPAYRYTRTPVRRYTNTPVHSNTRTPVQLQAYIRIPLQRYTGTLAHWYTGTPVHLHMYTGTPNGPKDEMDMRPMPQILHSVLDRTIQHLQSRSQKLGSAAWRVATKSAAAFRCNRRVRCQHLTVYLPSPYPLPAEGPQPPSQKVSTST